MVLRLRAGGSPRRWINQGTRARDDRDTTLDMARNLSNLASSLALERGEAARKDSVAFREEMTEELRGPWLLAKSMNKE